MLSLFTTLRANFKSTDNVIDIHGNNPKYFVIQYTENAQNKNTLFSPIGFHETLF